MIKERHNILCFIFLAIYEFTKIGIEINYINKMFRIPNDIFKYTRKDVQYTSSYVTYISEFGKSETMKSS